MTGDGAKVSAGEMELTPVALAEKEPLNPGARQKHFSG
jgi:hypothetical protein